MSTRRLATLRRSKTLTAPLPVVLEELSLSLDEFPFDHVDPSAKVIQLNLMDVELNKYYLFDYEIVNPTNRHHYLYDTTGDVNSGFISGRYFGKCVSVEGQSRTFRVMKRLSTGREYFKDYDCDDENCQRVWTTILPPVIGKTKVNIADIKPGREYTFEYTDARIHNYFRGKCEGFIRGVPALRVPSMPSRLFYLSQLNCPSIYLENLSGGKRTRVKKRRRKLNSKRYRK